MTATSKTLEERVQRIEDQMTIYQVISAYGPSADACNMDAIKQLWHEDCVYEIGGLGSYHGHAGMAEAFAGEFHQDKVKYGSGHASTLPYVVIEGDRAVATHHGTLFAHRDNQFQLIRLIASKWQLVRTPGKGLGWQILRRTNHLLNGDAAARELFSRILQDLDEVWVEEKK